MSTQGWTIYQNPSDYPGKHVVRRWFTRRNHGQVETMADVVPVAVADSLEAARRALPLSACARLARDPQDDPCIVEVWL